MSDKLNPAKLERLDKLVFRGGGTKGLEHVGTIAELDEVGALEDIRLVGGSSVGGIIALLVALGMQPSEIEQQMKTLDFKQFTDKSTPFWSEALGLKNIDVLGITNITDKIETAARVINSTAHGIYDGGAFADYIKLLIYTKTGNPNITFKELHNAATDPNSATYDPRFKDIILTGSKIDPQPAELRIFDWHQTPDMPIWQAIRITMSFPGAFKGVNYNGELFVDGGLKDNLPIKPAISFKTEPDDYHFRNSNPHGGVLGVSMENTSTIDYIEGNARTIPPQSAPMDVLTYGKAIITAPLKNIEVLREFKDNIIMPDDLGEATLNFEMTEKTKIDLLTEGHIAAKKKLLQREDWNNYQEYHDTHDKEHIIAQWKKRKAFITAGIAEQEIKDIETKYKSFDITCDDTENAYREKLDSIFQARQLARKQAIKCANERMKITEEIISLSQAKESINIVGEILQEYNVHKNTHKMLTGLASIILDLNGTITKIIETNNNSKTQSAFIILESKLQEILLHKFESQTTFKDAMQTITTTLSNELKLLDLQPEQINNFINVLQLYGNYSYSNKDRIPPIPQGQNLLQYQELLQNHSVTIDTAVKQSEENLQQLEIDCYKNGMQLLYPDQHKIIAATKNEACTMHRLAAEHKKARTHYNAAITSGKIADITNAFSSQHYSKIVLAKTSTFDAINKSTGFALKFADLLQRNCTFLYNSFHCLACFNPFSTYKSVVLMRQVHEQLKLVQQYLENKPDFYAHDPVSQNYITAIETMSRELHDKTNSIDANSKKHEKPLHKKLISEPNSTKPRSKQKINQDLYKLLTNFAQHRKSIAEPQKLIQPTVTVPKQPRKN